jgi:hypothetical protein
MCNLCFDFCIIHLRLVFWIMCHRKKIFRRTSDRFRSQRKPSKWHSSRSNSNGSKVVEPVNLEATIHWSDLEKMSSDVFRGKSIRKSEAEKMQLLCKMLILLKNWQHLVKLNWRSQILSLSQPKSAFSNIHNKHLKFSSDDGSWNIINDLWT